jgi:hypothetical protein
MPPRPTCIAVPRITKRQRVQEFLQGNAPDWDQLRAAFPDVSESSLRDWLREAGIRLPQPHRGVWTKTLDELEESLNDMAEAYRTEPKICRSLVITAKDRTRFASRNPKVEEAKRAEKEEMVQWMLVWLDDPAMFATWVRLRRNSR